MKCDEEKTTKQSNMKMFIRGGMIFLVFLAFVLILNFIITPFYTYFSAKKAISDKNYVKAYESLLVMGDFLDCENIRQSIKMDYYNEEFQNASEKDAVIFGHYNSSNRWLILAKESNKALILSEYVVGEREFNEKEGKTTWEECSLRKWLNKDFINDAFSEEEREIIAETSLHTGNSEEYESFGGKDTRDKVFLLSIDEVKRYLEETHNMEGKLTDGTIVAWWLRSPGLTNEYAACVCGYGEIGEAGLYSTYKGSVRPAMWIDIDKIS
ncbi:hypothetical protein SAMN05216249_103153 [Acetitomaculum ruminis DSM 5522]|uniref:DUF6273 domain-containing protein n=1 Tax=Acetitomaculum ruminis DSM 5522 TaxID=1120918 RepID=A0A1I0W853_9FIRM|nr:DUF6273 domain-containing protein [Acetitomaculum ruminis]SFA84915.1 hypothetical protein SAMN05216249_103153 [Acetitomaculum ruminis DSM 5522]